MAAIFFYHLWSVQPGGDQNPFGPILGDFLSQGYLGVVVFNAITGFVLTLPHADPGGKPALAFTDFFRRRFGRIVPQYYLSLALWTLVALVAGTMLISMPIPPNSPEVLTCISLNSSFDKKLECGSSCCSMRDYPRRLKAKNIPCIVDPGQSTTAFSGDDLAEMLTGATYLISNDYELQLIENATKLSLAEIRSRADTVITTLGENGSIVRQGATETHIPPCPAEDVQDPTGAGDAFRAGFLKGLTLGKTPTEAAKLGSVSAAYAVEQHGTQEHRYTFAEFCARYAASFGPLEIK